MRVEPLSKPITTALLLDELKDHLRIDGAEEDASLGAFTASATTLVETYLDMALVHRSVVIYLDAWGADKSGSIDWWQGVVDGSLTELQAESEALLLPVKPVSSIDKIEIHTAVGGTVLWGADNYYLKQGLAPVIVKKLGRSWPVPGVPVEGIQIHVTAGFGPSWNDVPATIRQAILMLAAYFYYNRGDGEVASAMKASGAEGLLASYKRMRL